MKTLFGRMERKTSTKGIDVDNVVQLPSGDAGLHNNIVRLNNLHIDSKKRDISRFFRREAVVVENIKNKEKVLRYVMGNPGGISISKSGAALDYDAIDGLGIKYREAVSLKIRRASAAEIYQWFWIYPDLGIRLSIRLGVVGAMLGIMGFLTGIITALL